MIVDCRPIVSAVLRHQGQKAALHLLEGYLCARPPQEVKSEPLTSHQYLHVSQILINLRVHGKRPNVQASLSRQEGNPSPSVDNERPGPEQIVQDGDVRQENQQPVTVPGRCRIHVAFAMEAPSWSWCLSSPELVTTIGLLDHYFPHLVSCSPLSPTGYFIFEES